MSYGAVDGNVPESDEDEQRTILDSIREGSTYKSSRNNGKGELVGGEYALGDSGCELVHRVGGDAPVPEATRVSNKRTAVLVCFHGKRALCGRSKGETVSEGEEDEGDETGEREGLLCAGEGISHSNHARVIQSQSRHRHQEDQRRAEDHKACIAST